MSKSRHRISLDKQRRAESARVAGRRSSYIHGRAAPRAGEVGYTAPGDQVSIASIGMARRGMTITTELPAQSGAQVGAVGGCDPLHCKECAA